MPDREEREPPYAPFDGGKLVTYTLFIILPFLYDALLSGTHFNLHAVQNDLKDNIHQQPDAVDVVIQALGQMYIHDEDLNLLCLVGPSGVGKTYTTNIIKKHFLTPIYECSGPPKQEETKKILKQLQNQNFDLYNLIIIDDLTSADVDGAINFIKEIPQDFLFLVICVFSIQETDDQLNSTINYNQVDKIRDKFLEAGLKLKLAAYREFTTSQAANWVDRQLILRGVNPDFRDDILKAVDDHDIKYKGLKGLDAKIRLIL